MAAQIDGARVGLVLILGMIEDLERVATEKGEWLEFRGEEPGRASGMLLPDIITETLAQDIEPDWEMGY